MTDNRAKTHDQYKGYTTESMHTQWIETPLSFYPPTLLEGQGWYETTIKTNENATEGSGFMVTKVIHSGSHAHVG